MKAKWEQCVKKLHHASETIESEIANICRCLNFYEHIFI